MKKTSAELKTLAKQSLVGNYGVAVSSLILLYVAMMIIVVILKVFVSLGMVMFFSVLKEESVLAFLLIMLLLIGSILILDFMIVPGFISLYLNICNHKKGEIGDIFFAFKHSPFKFFLLSLMIAGSMIAVAAVNFAVNYFMSMSMGIIFVNMAQSVFFIVVYILYFYLFLNYGLLYFLLVDNPEKSIGTCLRESKQLMTGHKGRFFYMMVSFIGWYLIGYCTFGLAFLWLIPYIGCTFGHFYLDLKQDFTFHAV